MYILVRKDHNSTPLIICHTLYIIRHTHYIIYVRRRVVRADGCLAVGPLRRALGVGAGRP